MTNPNPRTEAGLDGVGLLACPFCGGEAKWIDVNEDEGFDNIGGSCIACTPLQCFVECAVWTEGEPAVRLEHPRAPAFARCGGGGAGRSRTTGDCNNHRRARSRMGGA